MNEQWRTNMREKLDGHRQAAPLLSWDEVERRAAAVEKSAKVAAWGRRAMAAAAVVICLCGVAATLLLLNNGQNAQQVANLERHYAPQHNTTNLANNTNAAGHYTETRQGTNTNNMAGSYNKANYYACGNRNNVNTSHATNLYAAVPDEYQQKATQPQTDIIETTTDTKQQITDYTSKNSTDNAPRGKQTTTTQPKRTENLPVGVTQTTTKPANVAGAWMAKAYVSGGALGANNSQMQHPTLATARTYGETADEAVRNSEYVRLDNASPTVETKAHHRQPLRVGAAVRYALSNRWSIDAGLTYARHRSDITRKMGNVVNETQQTLHYLGVPLNVNYRIAGNRRFNVYAAAGVMGEKLLKGKRKTVAQYEDMPDDVQTESVKEGRAQLSVNAAIGAEYKIDDRLSVFAEPGISHYFDNGSELSSIYKERPTNFNLNVGLRFCVNR
jgi:hypothetical protein